MINRQTARSTLKALCLVCLTATAFPLTAGSLSSASSGNTIPSGMIAAFEGSCPSGWSNYSKAAGRSLVGDGTLSQSYRGQNYSANYSIGQKGGVRAYRLAGSEIPSNKRGTDATKFESCWDCPGNPTSTSQTSHSGYGSAFDNQDPYLVVNFCKKN